MAIMTIVIREQDEVP